MKVEQTGVYRRRREEEERSAEEGWGRDVREGTGGAERRSGGRRRRGEEERVETERYCLEMRCLQRAPLGPLFNKQIKHQRLDLLFSTLWGDLQARLNQSFICLLHLERVEKY